MNAPEGIIAATLEFLPLSAITPSETPAQVRRRKRYTAESIAELAQNVKAQGVIQPVIVRKLLAMREFSAYELVAGERRWLASKEAGLAHIPAIVRDIDDADLISFQLSENLKRESLDALEEAEGFNDLIHDAAKRGKKVKAENIAELFGVSKRHVYNRLKLLQVKHPAAQEALASGRLDHTKALLVARYPSVKLQGKAFEIVTAADTAGTEISLREAAERLRDKLMVRLDDVPFDIEDDSFRNEGRVQFDSQVTHRHRDSVVMATPIPACISCHNCSATDSEFGAEIEAAYGKGVIVCTERPCHDFKVKTFFERRVQAAREAGLTIIDGVSLDRREIADKYIALDEPCYEAGLKTFGAETRLPTYREILGKAALASALLIDPRNKQPRELMALDAAIPALKKLGVKKATLTQPPAGTESPAESESPEKRQADREAERREAEKQAQREELERVFRRKLLAEIHAKWKGPLKRDELQEACDRLMDGGEWPAFIDELYSEEIETSRMREHELARLLFELTVGLCIDYLGDSPQLLLAAAKRFRIDPAKVRRHAKAELGGVDDEPAEKKLAAKKKGKRK